MGAGMGAVGGAKLTYDTGSALGKSAAQAGGETLKSIGNGIKAN